jgi:RIO kinase 1
VPAHDDFSHAHYSSAAPDEPTPDEPTPDEPTPDEPTPDEPTPDEPMWSSWDGAQHGPLPYPDWLITDGSAVDEDLGVLKTGKEADVHLVSRAAPDGRVALLAAKRYRDGEHRMFHRDAGYLEGRRVRGSRETRAMARRSQFGRQLLAGQWAAAEFAALAALWQAGAPVPYPVQLRGSELMLEFIGEPDGTAAPRLAQTRPAADEAAELYEQCRAALRLLSRAGYAHGDLSAYNALVHRGRLVLIDLPQIVDVVANPQGPGFLHRDCVAICAWFARRGVAAADPEALFGELIGLALAGW